MDTTLLEALIKPELAILVLALWVIGFMIKSIQKIPDEWIPFIVLAFGVVGACLTMGVVNVEAVLQGVLCTAVAVYGHQVVKQVEKGVNKSIDESFKK